uniref:Coagulation factor XIII B chain n=1 Tax=Catharus ustulatus TaxID=91951 RepID=A0A8C3TUB7_CATUS
FLLLLRIVAFGGKYIDLFADTPCDLPQLENGNLPQYYYSFKSYYFPMHKGKKLSYSCVVGYTTESGTQEGRITCTAKGWSPVPRCYSELVLFISSLLPKLQYKCNPGYHTPSGATEDTVQCQPQGWSFQPSCTKKLGSILHVSPLLRHGSYPGAEREVRLNGTLRYRCEQGFRTAAGSASETALCLAHGWARAPSCTSSSCWGEPSPIGFHCCKVYEEGDVVHFFCDSYKNGSWVEYGCQHYHFLDGPSIVYCDHGNWTEQPTCLEPCILNVTDMDSNNLTLKWRREKLIFLHGDLIEFECKQGYDFLQTASPSPGRTQCDHGRLKYPKCVIQGKAIFSYYVFN